MEQTVVTEIVGSLVDALDRLHKRGGSMLVCLFVGVLCLILSAFVTGTQKWAFLAIGSAIVVAFFAYTLLERFKFQSTKARIIRDNQKMLDAFQQVTIALPDCLEQFQSLLLAYSQHSMKAAVKFGPLCEAAIGKDLAVVASVRGISLAIENGAASTKSLAKEVRDAFHGADPTPILQGVAALKDAQSNLENALRMERQADVSAQIDETDRRLRTLLGQYLPIAQGVSDAFGHAWGFMQDKMLAVGLLIGHENAEKIRRAADDLPAFRELVRRLSDHLAKSDGHAGA